MTNISVPVNHEYEATLIIWACPTVASLRLNLCGRCFQPINGHKGITPELEEFFTQRLPWDCSGIWNYLNSAATPGPSMLLYSYLEMAWI